MALAAASSTQLGCGRDIDHLWEHLDWAPDAHELACPYCRAARADLAGLAQATRELRDRDEHDPELQPSRQVLDQIMAVARAEVRRGRRIPLDRPGADQTSRNTVSEQAVTAVIRRVGDATNNIQIRRCAITPDTVEHVDGTGTADDVSTAVTVGVVGSSGRAVVDTGPAAVTASLRVSVAHDVAIAEASSRLRDAVRAAVSQEVGVDVTTIHINVEDLYDV